MDDSFIVNVIPVKYRCQGNPQLHIHRPEGKPVFELLPNITVLKFSGRRETIKRASFSKLQLYHDDLHALLAKLALQKHFMRTLCLCFFVFFHWASFKPASHNTRVMKFGGCNEHQRLPPPIWRPMLIDQHGEWIFKHGVKLAYIHWSNDHETRVHLVRTQTWSVKYIQHNKSAVKLKFTKHITKN